MIEVDDALNRWGGKAVSLIRLAEAGLPVPAFVTIPADEYRDFIDHANLHAPLFDALTAVSPAEASATIASAFAAAKLRRKQRERLLALVAPLGEGPVAVRSSATAEDLPDLSFAGQLDSFLDVSGPDDTLARIIDCWASAWTERAIAYRERNAVPHDDIAVAVIVQRMVAAEASGVMFTANPLTGRRDETVVDAVFGLGEALVQGQITPDSYRLDTATAGVLARTIVGDRPALEVTHLRTLNALGRRIVALFGSPQDIEWVRVGDDLQIVQSRPITSLYPLPDTDPASLWLSFGAFQGMLEPLTPLGQDLLRHLLAGAGRSFGRVVDPATNAFVRTAGERLWLRIDQVLRTEPGRRVAETMMPMVDPAAARIIATLLTEPGFAPTRRTPSLVAGLGLASFAAKMAPAVPSLVRRPAAARANLDERVDKMLRDLERSLASAAKPADPRLRLEGLVMVIEQFGRTGMPTLLPAFGPIMGPGLLATRELREVASRSGLPDADALALHALRALPGNVTTAMDFALWDTATAIRSDPHAWGVVADTDPVELARLYRARNLPTAALEAVDAFLADYGMRGIAEIDLGTPRWRDDPTPVFATLQSYLSIDADASPREAHRAGQREAGRAITRLMQHSTRSDARRIQDLASRIRATMGARESPKFALVRCFGLLRDALDAEAAVLVEHGVIAAPSDIAFLTFDELRHAYDTPGLADQVGQRRAVRAREARRTLIPRVIVGDGRTFYSAAAEPGALAGSGVSPGVAEGIVRVVFDPRTDQVAPGEILVCPGTDPAWTPLFHHAAGLITEVGGLMTHGSVVAREYGIPAIAGVDGATTALSTGQRIRIDGTAGTIDVL